MDIEQVLQELRTRHQDLEVALAEAMAHPATSDDEITALKRQKLRLKDLIADCERQIQAGLSKATQ